MTPAKSLVPGIHALAQRMGSPISLISAREIAERVCHIHAPFCDDNLPTIRAEIAREIARVTGFAPLDWAGG